MSLNLEQYRRGTHLVNREMLEQIPITDRGGRTDRWSGIQHGDLAQTLLERIDAAGFEVSGEAWSIGRNGAHLFAYLDLDVGNAVMDLSAMQEADQTGVLDSWRHGFAGFDPRVVSLRMGVMHSNDSTLSLRLVVIPVVLVCSNGMSVEGGMVAVQKKHTSGLDLVSVLDAGIQTYVLRAQSIDQTISALRAVDLHHPSAADHLIVEAGRRKLFPWSQLGKVEHHWRCPPHPDFEERSGWSLMNAFSEVAKSFSMKNEMIAVDRIRRLILAGNGRS